MRAVTDWEGKSFLPISPEIVSLARALKSRSRYSPQ